MNLTCYHCGGTKFLLVIVDREAFDGNGHRFTYPVSEIRCHSYADHLADTD